MSGLSNSELEHIFNELGKIGEDDFGIQRLAFTPAENQAHDFIKNKLDQLDIAYRVDHFGNLIARVEGCNKNATVVAVGSHLDSVPNGGKYDGAVGVITSLYALAQLKNQSLNHPIELIIFRAEESSRFGHSCMASKLINGCADLSLWQTSPDPDGKTVFDALKDNGFDPDNLSQTRINPADYKAFIECHIEQGLVLEQAALSLGIVSAIAAPTRFLVEINGTADHSGATPMHLRHDALIAASQIVLKVNELANQQAQYGTVGTVGRLNVSPNSMNVIPGQVSMNIDIRGVNEASIQRTCEALLAFINTITHVSITTTCLAAEKPVQLNADIANILRAACQEEKIPFKAMNSGAGHDAMYMAKNIPTAMLFVPSVGGISHNQQEHTPFADIYNAAKVLTKAIEKLAS